MHMISISRSADPICLIFKRTPIFNGIQLNFTIMQNGKLFLSYKNENKSFWGNVKLYHKNEKYMHSLTQIDQNSKFWRFQMVF